VGTARSGRCPPIRQTRGQRAWTRCSLKLGRRRWASLSARPEERDHDTYLPAESTSAVAYLIPRAAVRSSHVRF
jgi:hypothetical protein